MTMISCDLCAAKDQAHDPENDPPFKSPLFKWVALLLVTVSLQQGITYEQRYASPPKSALQTQVSCAALHVFPSSDRIKARSETMKFLVDPSDFLRCRSALYEGSHGMCSCPAFKEEVFH